MYTGELCELHGWWINLDSTIQFPTKTKTTDEFMQITTRNELHCPFLFFSVSLKIYVALKTRRSLFSNIFAYRLTPGIRCGVLILFTDFPMPATHKYTRTLAIIIHEYIMCVTRNILTFHWHCYETQLSWLHW